MTDLEKLFSYVLHNPGELTAVLKENIILENVSIVMHWDEDGNLDWWGTLGEIEHDF